MPKLWRITLLVEANEDATQEDIEEFVHDLEWSGGCRDPDNDPMFDSVEIVEKTVARGRQSARGKSRGDTLCPTGESAP